MISNIWNANNYDGTYTNPILYADYSDPDAIRVGDDYFMVSSSFCNVPGIPVLHSKNLVNWEIINYVLDELPDDRYNVPVHGCGVWAPSIRFHDGLFYVCFPMPDEGIFMSTTNNPYEKWSTPVNIRPGKGWIDPCPFWDDDGKAYLVAGVAKSRIGYKSVLHIVEMSTNGMSLIGDEIKIFDGSVNGQETIEGPKLYKRNGYYYIFAPAGGVKTGWQSVLRSKNVYGPYECRIVMKQGDTDINGPHQGAWVDTVAGEDYFIHFQDVESAGRIIHLQPMTWENDWPVIGVSKDGNEYGEPVKKYKVPINDDSIMEIETSDDFSGEKLGLQWQWNANISDDFYKIDSKGLNLFAMKKCTDYSDVPSLLLQKWPAPEFECVYDFDVSNLEDGDEAGIISLGIQYGAVLIRKNANHFELFSVMGEQHFGSVLVETTTQNECRIKEKLEIQGDIFIKYRVSNAGKIATFYFSNDGIEYEEVLKMTPVPGRWVGVKNGIFCLSNKESGSGKLNVKSVEYR